MTHENERELSAAVLATMLATLSLAGTRGQTTMRGGGPPLTELHRKMLRDAAHVFTRTAALLSGMVDDAERP